MVGGHLVPFHPLPEKAFGLARLQGRSAFPPLGCRGGVDERQPPVGVEPGMAFEAARDEKRGDLPVEVDGGELRLLRSSAQRWRDRGADRDQDQGERAEAHGRSP